MEIKCFAFFSSQNTFKHIQRSIITRKVLTVYWFLNSVDERNYYLNNSRKDFQ